MHEKYEEQNGWQSRLERERRSLSASVEATLLDQRSRTQANRDVSQGQIGFSETIGGTALIPPRFTLQSRAISAVQPGAESAYDNYSSPAFPSDSVARPFSAEPQVYQIASLAQTLTGDFARFGYDPSLATTHPMAPLPRAAHVSSFSPDSAHAPSALSPDLSLLRGNVPAPFPTIAPSQLPPSQAEVRHRLGGRPTRIRLEVPTNEQAAHRFLDHRSDIQTTEQKDAPSLQSEQLPSARTSAHLPALDLFRKVPASTTSTRMPVIDMVKEQLEASRRGLVGTGLFACGQSDLIVTNKYVTSTCVILVTFTANPGPVVVHYISLQPRIGFTVHLTAPTITDTSFNYVIFLDA